MGKSQVLIPGPIRVWANGAFPAPVASCQYSSVAESPNLPVSWLKQVWEVVVQLQLLVPQIAQLEQQLPARLRVVRQPVA
jgi:hypothetical protein